MELIIIKHRYGAQETVRVSPLLRETLRRLLAELATEQFSEPDNEHTQVAVTHSSGWLLTVDVSGLVTWENAERVVRQALGEAIETEEGLVPRYLRDVPKEALINLLTWLAQGKIEKVKALPWSTWDTLPPYVQDYFRK